MDKTFTISEDKTKPSNINGVWTTNTDYIIRCLNEEIGKILDFKKKFERERENNSSLTFNHFSSNEKLNIKEYLVESFKV